MDDFNAKLTDKTKLVAIAHISNVLGMKEHMSEVKITVHEDMCAGLSLATHKAAIDVMRSCQVNLSC